MKNAFANADFSKLNDRNLAISAIVHKTFIDITEDGTKAAAVTAVYFYGTATIPEFINVTLNRPFVYAIIDNSTNLPIFIGTVIDFE